MSKDTQEPTAIASPSVMVTSNASWFIFVRYWPGFTDRFPHTNFDFIADDVIDAQLWAALKNELMRQNADRRAVERIEDETTKFLDARFMLLAELVGWSDGLHRIEGDGKPRLCTRKLCIGVTESAEEAQAALEELSSRAGIQSNCAACEGDWIHASWECPFSNPRYTYAPCENFDRGERTRAKLAIDHLRSGDVLDAVERHAKLSLQIIDAFHVQWEGADSAITGKTAAVARELGTIIETTNDIDGKAIIGNDKTTETLTPQDIADLFGITKARVLNVLWEDRPTSPPIKKGGRAADSYYYSELRPWLIKHWPDKSPLLNEFSDVQRILRDMRTHKPARKSRQQ